MTDPLLQDPHNVPADAPPLSDDLQMLRRSHTREHYRIVQRVQFNRELTPLEFRQWLEANHWLAYHPNGYGPVTIEVAGSVGIYVHSASTGD